jgi:hypothetical protein
MEYMVKIHISAFVQIVKCPYFFFRKNKSYVFALSLQYRVPANKKDNSCQKGEGKYVKMGDSNERFKHTIFCKSYNVIDACYW